MPKKGRTARSNNKKKKNKKKLSSSSKVAENGSGAKAVLELEAELEAAKAELDAKLEAEYPMSKYYVISRNLYKNGKHGDADEAVKHGAENEGCLWCILPYAEILKGKDNFHEAIAWFIEGAIRGDMISIFSLVSYYISRKEKAYALCNFWLKIGSEFDPSSRHFETFDRKAVTKKIQRTCITCGMTDLPEQEHNICEGCRVCSYCSDCQKEGKQKAHWIAFHRGECRQLKILKNYYRKYAKEIRHKIISRVDPTSIEQLQILRTKLGLNIPKEDYIPNEALLIECSQHVGRNNGTLVVGSTPNLI